MIPHAAEAEAPYSEAFLAEKKGLGPELLGDGARQAETPFSDVMLLTGMMVILLAA